VFHDKGFELYTGSLTVVNASGTLGGGAKQIKVQVIDIEKGES